MQLAVIPMKVQYNRNAKDYQTEEAEIIVSGTFVPKTGDTQKNIKILNEDGFIEIPLEDTIRGKNKTIEIEETAEQKKKKELEQEKAFTEMQEKGTNLINNLKCIQIIYILEKL